jgi:hypothetical protein
MHSRHGIGTSGSLTTPGDTRRAERAVWSDEIAIDFPSVPALTARVRDAFAVEDGAPGPFHAEVVLTPAQARNGVELPLVVSQRHPCPACAGRGEQWLEPCARCQGDGEYTSSIGVLVTIPPHMNPGDRCTTPIDGIQPPAVLVLRVFVDGDSVVTA